MTNRVLVTGLGVISGSGLNIPEFWDALASGRTSIGAISDNFKSLNITKAAQISDYSPDNYFQSSEIALLDRFSQYAIVAAREAVQDALLLNNDNIFRDAACIIGTGCGGKYTDEDTYYKLYKENKSRVHPLTILKGMPSAAASMVSKEFKIKGPVFSITSACASGSHAIIQGSILIQNGLVDVALVGGVDAPFTYGLLKSWESLRVVSNDTCRPFSKDRSGMVLGEGAGFLVLESERHAHHRNTKCYAELAGFGMSSDAGHVTRPDVNGIAAAMVSALRGAKIHPNDIDYINAHGTGTIANDIAETSAIREVFGEHAEKLAVTSTKSMHGHALGASSALEMISTILAIENNVIPPTANFTEPGEGCDLDYVPNKPRIRNINTALSNSFAFGGLNAVIAVSSI